MNATDRVERVRANMLAETLAQGKRITLMINVDDLQDILDKSGSCMRYNGKFFDRVDEANLQPHFVSFDQCSIHDIGGGYYTEPYVDIVPKGTKIEYGMYVLPFTRK